MSIHPPLRSIASYWLRTPSERQQERLLQVIEKLNQRVRGEGNIRTLTEARDLLNLAIAAGDD